MRLIDVEKLKQYIDDCECCEKCDMKGFMCHEDCELPDCVTPQWERVLNEQPTVDDVSVRHGQWKQTEVVHKCFDIQGFITWGIKYMCESCGFKTIAIEGHFTQYNFCPNCGARMDKDEID